MDAHHNRPMVWLAGALICLVLSFGIKTGPVSGE